MIQNSLKDYEKKSFYFPPKILISSISSHIKMHLPIVKSRYTRVLHRKRKTPLYMLNEDNS